MGIPNPKRKRWALRNAKWILKAASAVPVLIGGIWGTIKVHAQLAAAHARMMESDGGPLDFTGVWMIAGGVGLSVVIVLLESAVIHQEIVESEEKENPIDLWGCCLVLFHALRACHPNETADGLRITVYRVSKRKKGSAQTLVQLIPYASDAPPNYAHVSREHVGNAGIIGRVAQRGEPMSAKRVSETEADFVKEMIDWGYATEEARHMDQTRGAWMGCPILDDRGKVEGVMYLDSSDRAYFTDERLVLITQAVEAVTRYGKERYK